MCMSARGWDTRRGGGVVSRRDETHLGMNASPFISLFSGIHSQRLMERGDKEERRYEWSDFEREGTEE